MAGVVVMLLELLARVVDVGDRTRQPRCSPAALTRSASSSTVNCSVNWLNTRSSPGPAGWAAARATQAIVSRMFR